MVLYPNKLPESERVCSGICKEAPECYWAYTTERTEKEALKLYLAHYGTMQEAITHIEADRKRDGGHKYLEFARKVNQHQKVMSLWST